MYPNIIYIYIYILWAQCTHIGTTLRPMYIPYEYMDPQGYIPAISPPLGEKRNTTSKFGTTVRAVDFLGTQPEVPCRILNSIAAAHADPEQVRYKKQDVHFPQGWGVLAPTAPWHETCCHFFGFRASGSRFFGWGLGFRV